MTSGHPQAPRAWPGPARPGWCWATAALAVAAVVAGCWLEWPSYHGTAVEYPWVAVAALGAGTLLGGWRASRRHWVVRAALGLLAVGVLAPLGANTGWRAVGELAGAAAVEELTFRVALPALLAGGLLRYGPRAARAGRVAWPVAWGLAAVGFALLPGHLAQPVPVTSFVAFALVQSWILWWNRDLVLLVATHTLLNAAALAPPAGWTPGGYQRTVLVLAVAGATWGGRWAARADDDRARAAGPDPTG